MTMTTRDKLAWAAAKLFQEKGFHGVGLNEILASAGLPKGSLYHHFPNGKVDLALEAAAFTHRETTRIIDDAFRDARDFPDGARTLLHKMAKMFEIMGSYTGCPITSILFAGPEYEVFCEKSAEYFECWITQMTAHAERLGCDPVQARVEGEKAFHTLQGGWTLARARRDSDVMRNLAYQTWPETTSVAQATA